MRPSQGKRARDLETGSRTGRVSLQLPESVSCLSLHLDFIVTSFFCPWLGPRFRAGLLPLFLCSFSFLSRAVSYPVVLRLLCVFDVVLCGLRSVISNPCPCISSQLAS